MDPNVKNDLLFDTASMLETPISILLVEDNPGDVLIIRELLKATGIDFTLRHVTTLRETLILCVEHAFNVILLDLGLSDSLGLETLKKILVFNMKSPVVVMTGLDDEDIALESLREGAQDYLVKNRLTSDTLLRGIKYGIERKKIQDLLKKNAKQFSLLSSTTTAINESEETSPIFSLSCRNIAALLDNSGTIAVDNTTQGKVYTSGIESLKPWFDQITGMTGLNMNNPVFHSGDKVTGMFGLFEDGKLNKLTVKPGGNFKNGAGGAKRSGRETDIDIYGIGFVKSGTIYGGVLIFTPEPVGADDSSMIEAICNQVSLSLHRRSIEEDLRSSKNKYRKLSKDLEKKVRDRTRDLETSNYQLSQELVERHLAEEALKKSEIRLRELNATKDKFFNIIAHDLKNPFTCLLGSTELLNENLSRMSTDKIRELVQILNDSAKSGYAILQNLLDWSRSQTGMITFNPRRFDLKKLITDTIADQRLTCAKKDIKISSELKESMDIFADKNMISAVLRNLLDNAIKFTQRNGIVKVFASLRENEIVVSVKDSGIGIPGEKINDLFRIDTKYTRPGTNMEQGTGLGLKLCKEFIEKQGGTIFVKSIVGKGSEFIFSIPARES